VNSGNSDIVPRGATPRLAIISLSFSRHRVKGIEIGFA
jgi:hypothetical protein